MDLNMTAPIKAATSSTSKCLATVVCILSLSLALIAQPAQSHLTKADLVHVQTTSGLVQGFKADLATVKGDNQSVYKFLSVPYAEAPIGQLRFKRPVELVAANNASIVDATRFGKTCPQHKHLARFVSPLLNLDRDHQISEDCLRLSIYVPTSIVGDQQQQQQQQQSSGNQKRNGGLLKPCNRLPVTVWIPGEGFDFADERQFDGSHLAQATQSIVVSVQYRVGILGFLSDSRLNINGNMGAYDQLAALKWIKRNINSFGGDDQRVTLMGRFSGSMTISTLLTAPQQNLAKASEDGRPLFKRAILLSGLAVKDWIIEQQDGQRELVKSVHRLALERGFCSQAQLDDNSCLRTMPVEQLIDISGYGWKLVVDNELVGRQDPIETIREQPERLSSNVDAILLGETETEGTLCLYRHLLNQQQSNYARLISEDRLTPNDLYEMILDDSTTYFKYNSTRTNPIQMTLEALTSADSLAADAGQLRKKYLDACSSYMVKAHNGRFKRHLQARNNMMVANSATMKPVDVYHYSLKYKPSFSLAPDYIQTAAHGDDVPLIFGLVHNQARQAVSQADVLMTQKMSSYIGNFVHGNHPNADGTFAQTYRAPRACHAAQPANTANSGPKFVNKNFPFVMS